MQCGRTQSFASGQRGLHSQERVRELYVEVFQELETKNRMIYSNL